MDQERIFVNIAEIVEQYPPIGFAFLTSPSGVLKVSETVCCFVAFMCVVLANDTDPDSSSAYAHFIAVAIICCILSLLLIVVYVTMIIKRLDIPWNLFELFFNVIAALGLLSTTSHVAANIHNVDTLVAGTVFGFAACAVYILEIFFIVKGWKKRIIFKAVQEFRQSPEPEKFNN